MLNKKKYKYIS